MSYCRSCGVAIAGAGKFCIQCGGRVFVRDSDNVALPVSDALDAPAPPAPLPSAPMVLVYASAFCAAMVATSGLYWAGQGLWRTSDEASYAQGNVDYPVAVADAEMDNVAEQPAASPSNAPPLDTSGQAELAGLLNTGGGGDAAQGAGGSGMGVLALDFNQCGFGGPIDARLDSMEQQTIAATARPEIGSAVDHTEKFSYNLNGLPVTALYVSYIQGIGATRSVYFDVDVPKLRQALAAANYQIDGNGQIRSGSGGVTYQIESTVTNDPGLSQLICSANRG